MRLLNEHNNVTIDDIPSSCYAPLGKDVVEDLFDNNDYFDGMSVEEVSRWLGIMKHYYSLEDYNRLHPDEHLAEEELRESYTVISLCYMEGFVLY